VPRNRQPALLKVTATKIVFEYGFLFDKFQEENAVAFDAWGSQVTTLFIKA
jgi:hypothetical protein